MDYFVTKEKKLVQFKWESEESLVKCGSIAREQINLKGQKECINTIWPPMGILLLGDTGTLHFRF